MTIWLWVGFLVFVMAMLALDLGVFHRKLHAISIKEAMLWTGFWIFLSLLFNILIYFMYEHHWLGIGEAIGHTLSGKEAALQFLTGYFIEKSLSLDNIFVIALIFTYFKIPDIYQHRVLFWGILGALIMRGLMIGGGIALITKFGWMIYVFGAFLIFTAIKMITSQEENIDPDRNIFVKFVRRIYPVSKTLDGEKFFTAVNGKHAVTPMFIALVVIESSDLLFAVDSIPAIFAVTLDPFIVFTSNVFAILGLRSLYFALSAMLAKFRFIKLSLSFILAYVGVKMLISAWLHIAAWVSLIVIFLLLLAGIMASILIKPSKD
ncbi:MAG: TerC family protein [Calditrichae bacterium]|nr:TerC family protein [Calditrichota bacterium]MCB9058418.1 TerC family protein [Calditrichia bacterium]